MVKAYFGVAHMKTKVSFGKGLLLLVTSGSSQTLDLAFD